MVTCCQKSGSMKLRILFYGNFMEFIVLLFILFCFWVLLSSQKNNNLSSSEKIKSYAKNDKKIEDHSLFDNKIINYNYFCDAKNLLSLDGESFKKIQGHSVYHKKYGHGIIGVAFEGQIGVFFQNSIYMESFCLSKLNYGVIIFVSIAVE